MTLAEAIAIALEQGNIGSQSALFPGIVNDNKNLFVHTAVEVFPYQNTALAIHLARLLSLLMGGVAVYFTYRLTLLLPPLASPTLTISRALAAAALDFFG